MASRAAPACIEEVKSKRADACIVDGAGATEFLKNNEGLKLSLMDKVDDDCFAIGFPKESPYYETFNNTLKEMMENGELDEIIAKPFKRTVYPGLRQCKKGLHI